MCHSSLSTVEKCFRYEDNNPLPILASITENVQGRILLKRFPLDLRMIKKHK